jgi:cytochrome c oxidase cbb3-type subunit 3
MLCPLRTLAFASALTLGAAALDAQQGTPPSLSAFQRAKAQALLNNKLPCLGCHTIAGTGGRIGPDLSNVGARLDRARIRQKIEDPRVATPGGIMPRVPLPPETLSLLVDYLSEQRSTPEAHSAPAAGAVSTNPAVKLYQTHCAACHGANGKGDGWNAQYLDRPPARHSDARAMSARTDDRLFDAIHAGGLIMGGSARMPPFGQSLTAAEIRQLVAHIRELCRCRQPVWANGTR